MNITHEAHEELKDLIEDSIQYICDNHMVSGETAWAVIECLAVAKQAQLQGICK